MKYFYGLTIIIVLALGAWGFFELEPKHSGVYVSRESDGVVEVVLMGEVQWREHITERLDNIEPDYDPNDPAYKFIPEADQSWIDEFGASERTRLLHTISELRVVVATQGKRLLALEE